MGRPSEKYIIHVDFEVYKQLMLRRTTEEVSFNDVLRELLGMPLKLDDGGSVTTPSGRGQDPERRNGDENGVLPEDGANDEFLHGHRGLRAQRGDERELPHGTRLTFTHRSRVYEAEIRDGKVHLLNPPEVYGEVYDSLSRAAARIARHPVNGWLGWMAKLPGESRWQRADIAGRQWVARKRQRHGR